jgi:hypothetical protein
MRSIILDYTNQIDVMTSNSTVKNYFTDIEYEINVVSKQGAYSTVSIYNNVGVGQVWLAKIVWNIPTTEPKANSYHMERWKFARWVEGRI